MRNLILLALLLSITTACSDAPAGSAYVNKTAIDVYILLDYTEGQSYESSDMNLSKIKRRCGDVNSITIQPIRDLSYSKKVTIDLTFEDTSHGSSFNLKALQRKATKDGQAALDKTVNDLNAKYSGNELNKSAIVNAVCDMLGSAKDGDKVFIFSDFLENFEGTNFRGMSPDKISSTLSNKCSAVNSSPDVYLLAEVFRAKDDPLMRVAIEGWLSYFAKSNISANVSTNL